MLFVYGPGSRSPQTPLLAGGHGLRHQVVIHDEAVADVLHDRFGDMETVLEIGGDRAAVVLVDRQHQLPATARVRDLPDMLDHHSAVAAALMARVHVEL